MSESNRLDFPSFTIGNYTVYPVSWRAETGWCTSAYGDAVVYKTIQEAVDVALSERDWDNYDD